MKILCVCGSPRDGNSESVIRKVSEILQEKGNEVETILVREKNIPRCDGCVEYCNHELKCKKQSDMQEIIEKMKKADAFVFAAPSYFSMPPGVFKDFMDMTCVIYTEQEETSKVFMDKPAVVIGIGAGELKWNKLLMENLNHYVTTLKMKCVGELFLVGKSEIPERDHILKQEGVVEELKDLISKLS